jgi:hypothetical protein
MAGRLTERMAAVLIEAAGRPSARAFNDGRPNYLRTRAGLITRGYLAERGEYDYLTPEGRAAVAERIDRIKAAPRGRGEAAELAEAAHLSELARRLGWRPTGGDRVRVIGGQVGMVLYNGHGAVAERCRRCGRACRYVDLSIGGNHTHYGYAQCEIAPEVETLAGHLTERADMLAETIASDPTYPAADRWRVELAGLRRLAVEVAEAGPISEEAGPEVAELAAAYDRAAAAYMAATTAGVAEQSGAGKEQRVAYDRLAAARRGEPAEPFPPFPVGRGARGEDLTGQAEPRCSIREGGNFRGRVVAECAGAAGGCPHCTRQAEAEAAFTPSAAAVASLAAELAKGRSEARCPYCGQAFYGLPNTDPIKHHVDYCEAAPEAEATGHTWLGCGHRADYASEAEHDRECPAAE